MKTGDGFPTGLYGLVHDSKDAALAFAAQRFINARLRRVGEITALSLDTISHSIQLRLSLHGESEPVDIRFSDVNVHRSGDGAALTLGHAVASREWLSGVLSEFVVGRPLHISRGAGRVLRLLT